MMGGGIRPRRDFTRHQKELVTSGVQQPLDLKENICTDCGKDMDNECVCGIEDEE